MSSTLKLVSLLVSIGSLCFLYTKSGRPQRSHKIARDEERIAIIGASSGIGLAIALRYAQRGARVCLVGRKRDELEEAREKCARAAKKKDDVLSVVADFTRAEELVQVRKVLKDRWGGLDTLVVSAGVSATRPLLEVAGGDQPDGPTAVGAQKAADVAQSAFDANYIGPLLSAVTFIPFMEHTSPAPSILLISSLGAAIPAPTRSLYGSSKAASLALYQALAIEHPKVAFTYILPSTVQGTFRSSAVDVDAGTQDTTRNHVGLTPEAVALRCERAVNSGEKVVYYPSFYRWAQLLYWFWPSYVERKAAKKYHFTT